MKLLKLTFAFLLLASLQIVAAQWFDVPPPVEARIGMVLGRTPTVVGGAAYNVWDSHENTTDLAANENLGAGNDITESSGEQTIDINTITSSAFTYDTFTAFNTTSFYYFDLKFSFNENFVNTWQNVYFAWATNTGTSPNTGAKAFMVYARYKGSNTWDIYFYTEDNGSNTYSPTYTAGTTGEIRLRVRMKCDDTTNTQIKWNDAAAVEISTNGLISRQVDRVFIGNYEFAATANITIIHFGITTDISEIGLATWE